MADAHIRYAQGLSAEEMDAFFKQRITEQLEASAEYFPKNKDEQVAVILDKILSLIEHFCDTAPKLDNLTG